MLSQQSPSRSIISAAGSGKTTFIVKETVSNSDSKVAVITYTNNNENEIKKKYYEANRTIPSNVFVSTWFQFLLQECVRPYQNFVYDKRRIDTIDFVSGKSAKFIPKANTEKYFFSQGRYIYNDKISEFACLCNEKSGGLVTQRLKKIFDEIYIDEVQDLAGYDFELLEMFLKSNIKLTLVGDNRQATYATNNSEKNKKFKGVNIINLLDKWEKQGLCEKQYRSQSHRCNQAICDLADGLYPDMPKTESLNNDITGHDGIFLVSSKEAENYILRYSPQILRFDVKTDTQGFPAINFGASKGLTFERVLIYPNNPIQKFLESGENTHIEKSKAKFYVALTRAKFSVAFVYNGICNKIGVTKWDAT